ncbi:hypothetical protein L7F22_058886 [Adiantum nelumboides]|nr:hypothetical protein [Adiantum nelumboides]
MQDVLVQKKQKLPIVYATRTEEMNMIRFQWEELDELCRSTIRLHLAESVSFSSSMPAKLLVSGEVSHTWILDSGALLHATPHRHWFTTYEETIGIVTLGDSYSCDIVDIGDIAMVMANGVKFTIHNSLPVVAKLIKNKRKQAEAITVEESHIKDDEVPVIQLDYKNRKQWEPLSGVILDGGAGVNIIGEHMKEK